MDEKRVDELLEMMRNAPKGNYVQDDNGKLILRSEIMDEIRSMVAVLVDQTLPRLDELGISRQLFLEALQCESKLLPGEFLEQAFERIISQLQLHKYED